MAIQFHIHSNNIKALIKYYRYNIEFKFFLFFKIFYEAKYRVARFNSKGGVTLVIFYINWLCVKNWYLNMLCNLLKFLFFEVELIYNVLILAMGFPGGSDGKESACNAEELDTTEWMNWLNWSTFILLGNHHHDPFPEMEISMLHLPKQKRCTDSS